MAPPPAPFRALSPYRAWEAMTLHKSRHVAAASLGVCLSTLHRALSRSPCPLPDSITEIGKAKAHIVRRLAPRYGSNSLATLRWALHRRWSKEAVQEALEQLAREGRIRLGGGRGGGSVTLVTPSQ